MMKVMKDTKGEILPRKPLPCEYQGFKPSSHPLLILGVGLSQGFWQFDAFVVAFFLPSYDSSIDKKRW